MTSCRDVDAIMTAYVDGELDAQDATAVDAHLAACHECRDRAAREHTVRSVVQVKALGLRERASSSLRAKCVAALPGQDRPHMADSVTLPTSRGRGRVSGWIPVSMAAAVILAVGGVLVFSQNRLEAAFAAQLAKDHEKCFFDRSSLDPGFDVSRAEAALQRMIGVSTSIPGETDAFDVIDVRYCQYDGGEMAHVLCEWRGQPVSLFVVPGRSRRERNIETIQHNAVIWSENDMGFALVAEQGPVEIGQVAAYVRARSD